MQSKIIHPRLLILVILVIAIQACNMPSGAATTPVLPTPGEQVAVVPVAAQAATSTAQPPTPTAPPVEIPATATVVVVHTVTPTDPKGGKLVYDVESASTAPEQRAPYGDSYNINRLERPFLQDMTYVSDLDIVSFTVTKDSNWWYVSMELIGKDPNNAQGINYGVELDLDRDGFGDYLIWAHPPYTEQWDTTTVQIFQDQNHNTGGLSGIKSDAPFTADGYETLVFDGKVGGSDPDMAWVRTNAGTVQFAFKKSIAGTVFMLGVLADAGFKDPGKLDYVDRLTIAEAGSSVKDNQNYPLKSLFLVDNTCREAFGFEATGYEPQICPVEPTPTKAPRQPQSGSTSESCKPPAGVVCITWDPIKCECKGFE
jgi:hypothetical protein